MTLVLAALAGCLYGIVHGLGPDHLTALATLLVGGADRRRAVVACVRFGVGHAVVLGALAGLATFGGFLVPEAWEQAAEATGGALLILLGAIALARALPLIVHRHAHTHDERGSPDHEHWHLHLGDPLRHRHRHGHGHAALVGGVLALSGVRALALAVSPLLLAGRSLSSALAFLLAFGLGVTVSMVAFGLLFQASRRFVGGSAGAVGVGGVSVLLGIFWIVASVT